MSRNELLAALQREAEERIQTLRAEAGEELAALRAECAERRTRCRREAEAAWHAAAEELRRRHAAAGRRRAQQIALVAEDRLAGRLRRLAADLLPQLADDCDDCWERLRDELPPVSWAEVRVAPRDLARGERDFAPATVTADPEISGGLVAVTAGGALRIDNTLEQRLERGWDDLLPVVFRALRLESEYDRPAAHS